MFGDLGREWVIARGSSNGDKLLADFFQPTAEAGSASRSPQANLIDASPWAAQHPPTPHPNTQ